MPETNNNLKRIKCVNCNKPLFFANIIEGIISIDCTNSQCRHRNVFEVKNGIIVNEVKVNRKEICRIHAECKRERVPCKFKNKHREVEHH